MGVSFSKLLDEVCAVAVWEAQVDECHVHWACPKHAACLRLRLCLTHDFEALLLEGSGHRFSNSGVVFDEEDGHLFCGFLPVFLQGQLQANLRAFPWRALYVDICSQKARPLVHTPYPHPASMGSETLLCQLEPLTVILYLGIERLFSTPHRD